MEADLNILRALAEIRTPFLNELFLLVTKLGEEVVPVLILCIIFWCVNKSMAYKVGISYFLSSLFVQGAKITFRIDRPWILDPNFTPVSEAVPAATGYSFPSGHTQGAVAIYGTIAATAKNIWVRVICIAAFLAVGFSRMYLGVHTPSDVLAAFLISAVSIVFVCLFYRGEELSRKKGIVLCALVLLGSIGLAVYAYCMYSSGIIAYEYVSDCFKAAGAGVGCALGYYIETNYINFSVKSKSIWIHILKVVLGLAGVLALRYGIKLIFGTSLAVSAIRYAVLIFWILAAWPWFIKKFFGVREEK